MLKLRDLDWRSIYSSSPIKDLECLERYCELAPNNDTAIEVGSYEGASTVILAQFFKRVIAIDPWGDHDVKPGDKIGTFTEGTEGTNPHFSIFMENMNRLGLCEIIAPVVGTVDDIKELSYIDAGLVFVDDGHSYSDCKRDIDAVLRHLNKNGILVCHDYYNETGGPCGSYIGVTEAVNKAIYDYNLEIIDHTGGIIALRRTSD